VHDAVLGTLLGGPVKKLENLNWRPRWVSHMGCVKGCADYLGLDISDAWIFGASGHAFVLNISPDLCPSGPTAWNTSMLPRLGRNAGYETEGVFGSRDEGTLTEAQERAWDLARRSIDEGTPCYGWELAIPEFYIVFGYDDEGYYVSGPGFAEGGGPKPWRDVGDTGIGCVEMCAVRPGSAADDATTIREALSFAREIAGGSSKWFFPQYGAGLRGYDVWIHGFESGTASHLGTAYNAAVWAECRKFAVEFLKEARERVGERAAAALDEAAGHYGEVSQALARVSEAYPFAAENTMDPVAVDAKSADAASALAGARDAEEAGLAAFEKVIAALEE
jgi:hypothetical protein